jgi:hypothetical protein
MKTSIQFATTLILAAATLVATGSIASAGEGGASGSIAAQFGTITTTVGTTTSSTPNVLTDLSGAVAVGKSSAASFARTANPATGPVETYASAIGAGGALTVTNANLATANAAAAADGTLGTAQSNTLTTPSTLKFTDKFSTSGITLP